MADISQTTLDLALAPVFDEIDEYHHLPRNWDGEGALPVSPEVVSRTKKLLRLILDQAERAQVPWHRPSVAPNPEGGLELSWERGDRWTMLIVRVGQAGVTCVTQEDGSEPTHQVVSIRDGAERALWAMRAV